MAVAGVRLAGVLNSILDPEVGVNGGQVRAGFL